MAKRVDPLKAKAAKQKKMAIGLCVLFVLVARLSGPEDAQDAEGPADGCGRHRRLGSDRPSRGRRGSPGRRSRSDHDAAYSRSPHGNGRARRDPDRHDLPARRAREQRPSGHGRAGSAALVRAVREQGSVQAAGRSDGGPGHGRRDDDQAGGRRSHRAKTRRARSEAPTIHRSRPAAASAAPARRAAQARPDRVAAPSPAAATTISVNGVVETIVEAQPFPADQPTFEVVSIAKDGKSVQIGVAGGTLAGGGATVKLTLGKVLTLQNTADGSRLQARSCSPSPAS